MSDSVQQQIAYEKLTSQLLARQQLVDQSIRSKSKIRWQFFLFALVFFIVSKYVLLRTQFKEVFTVFKDYSKNDAGYSCGVYDASAWNIVLNVVYPWLGQYWPQPLSQDQANFLWMAIRSNWIPTQDQINKASQCAGLNLVPLSYLCGNILAIWTNVTGKGIADVQSNADQSPWFWFLTGNQQTGSAILNDTNALQILLSQGLWGILTYVGHSGKSPQDMYNEIYTKNPPSPACSTLGQVANISTNAATFSMAGAVFGPAGAIIGGMAGLGLGMAQSGDQCGNSSTCNIM